ncbi:MAG: M23 family metallopeptidase [Spirochaetaceae bacterium]
MADKKEDKIERTVQALLEWLGENTSYSTSPARCTIDEITPATYLVSVVRIAQDELFAQEIFSSEMRGQIVYRSWTIRQEKGEWYVAGVEHLGKPVSYSNVPNHLIDFSRRIEILLSLQARSGPYYADTTLNSRDQLSIHLPTDGRLRRNGIFSRLHRVATRYSPAFTAAVISLGILLLLSIHLIRIHSVEESMSSSLSDYTSRMDSQVESFITNTEDEIYTLTNNLEENKKNFDFDRHNSYLNVTRMAEELPDYLTARKNAYELIAGNIREATSYSEIFYEMSRLPTEEYQARIFLASNLQSVIPLSRFKPAFSDIHYPVKLENEKNDGRGFRITDGYMTRREDPVGTGGVTPHFAVDIINVSNISYVNHAGEIIREGSPPGEVVAAYKGIIIDKDFDDRYGWNLEIEHSLTEEIEEQHPKAEKWSTYYAHLDSQTDLEVGEEVEADQPLGVIGDSGKSTGPHLHFEVRIYRPGGMYKNDEGERYNKINPFPEEKKQ